MKEKADMLSLVLEEGVNIIQPRLWYDTGASDIRDTTAELVSQSHLRE